MTAPVCVIGCLCMYLTPCMQFATNLRQDPNAAYQISPKPILDTNEYAKKDVGGKGEAHKCVLCMIIANCLYWSR